MKKIILLCLISIGSVFLYGEICSGIEVIKTIPSGKGAGELGIMETPNYSGLEGRAIGDDYFMNGPAAMCFDENGYLYVADHLNNRTVIYTPDFIYDRTIPMDNLEFYTPDLIKVYEEGLFFYRKWEYTGLYSYDGSLKWIVLLSGNGSPSDPYNYYYDEEKGLFFQYLENDKGIICYTELSQNKYNSRKLKNRAEINEYLQEQGFDNTLFIDESNNLVEKGKQVNFNTKYLLNGYVSSSVYPLNFDFAGNMYFSFERTNISINTPFAKFLKNIQYSDNNNRTDLITYPAVHPSGDIFLLDFPDGKESPTLKRIKNDWDVKGRESWYAEHTYATDNNVRIRSTPDSRGAKAGESG